MENLNEIENFEGMKTPGTQSKLEMPEMPEMPELTALTNELLNEAEA